ncbi:MAG TPA: SBBP repeat-containing protein [Pyrinomonadaceae bacterium]
MKNLTLKFSQLVSGAAVRGVTLALLLALALFGNLPFTSSASAPPAAPLPPPGAVAGSPVTDKQTRARVAESFGKLPLYFVENRGQIDKRVGYYVQGSDKTVYFTNEGLTFLLNPKSEAQPASRKADQQQAERWSLKLDFAGARPGVRPEGREPTGATFSYFKGPRTQWQAGLKSYSEIVYRELWPGIDLVYAGTVNRMKYTFVVKPGADPDRIKLAWRGAGGVKLNAAGELEVSTPAGGFTDERPVSWQQRDGRQVDVATKYRIEAKGEQGKQQRAKGAIAYGFEVGEYDRSRELVIDPAVLVYCGFLGGIEDDEADGIAVDSAGNAYVTGITQSTEPSFPVTVGPDLTHNGGQDAFVVKVNAGGTALVYCGFIGGSNFDEGNGIAVDSAGNAYVAGVTSSTEASFPVTVGPDLTSNGDNDAFVAKVNASGTALVYCGYIGGSDIETGFGIAVDSAGNAYVTGSTFSNEASFPVTVGPDLTFNGFLDAFVAKVNASGTVVYCGYIGGSGFDGGNGIAVDSAGNAYVTGQTDSTEADFPVTVGPDLTFNGFNDAFVAKVNAVGTVLVYCGYIGGSDRDSGNGIAVDSAGNAYVGGATRSTEADFPVTVGPDLIHNGGNDAFVAKVNTSGAALVYCGYIGGSGFDRGSGIGVDSAGNAYITGDTDSTEADFPVTDGPDLTHNGSDDAFVAKVNASGTALVYCGYIGGSDTDSGHAIAVDSAGNAYVTGRTFSTEAEGFPLTVGPDLTSNGDVDAFVAKVSTAPQGPTNKAQCKNGGWATFTNPTFSNQGQCIAYVNQLP